MELQKVKEEFRKFARPSCGQQGGYEMDGTADVVMYNFLDRRYADIEFMSFMYENLLKIEPETNYDPFFKVLVTAPYPIVREFIERYGHEEQVIFQLCWRLTCPVLMKELFSKIEDFDILENALFSMLRSSCNDKADVLDYVLEFNEGKFYWREHEVIDEDISKYW